MDFKSCPICDAKTVREATTCVCGYDYGFVEREAEKPKVAAKTKKK